MSESAATDDPDVVALGGGHGLAASLSALRRVTQRLTAVVTVADDGGSSGRLRRELGVLPPGDLRMALAALCGDDEWGQTWSRVVQHRFRSEGDLHDHAVGNLLIVALWELLGDSVEGLAWMGRLLGVQGRVLPMSVEPLEIEAVVEGPDGSATKGPRPGRGGDRSRPRRQRRARARPPAGLQPGGRCSPVRRLGGARTGLVVHECDPASAGAGPGRRAARDVGATARGTQPRAAGGRDKRFRP